LNAEGTNQATDAWSAYFSATSTTFTGLAEGSHTFDVRAKDEAGNVDPTPAEQSFSVDTAAPTGSVSINSGAAWTASTSVTLSLTYADVGGSGVDKVQYINDGVTYYGWENAAATKAWTLTSGDGTKTVYYQVGDVAGNVATFTDDIGLDTVNPTVSITSPADGSSLNTGSFTVSGTASDTNLDRVQIRINGGSYADASGTTSWTYGVSGLSDGIYTITAKAIDKAGNFRETSITITVNRITVESGFKSRRLTIIRIKPLPRQRRVRDFKQRQHE
jgi:hypothetical protein